MDENRKNFIAEKGTDKKTSPAISQLANILTLSRLLLAPVFVVIFWFESPWAAMAALFLAVVFELTDMLDGYIARNIAGVSSFGKLIDPLADSIARFSVFLAFTTETTVREDFWPVLLVALIFYRDAIVAYMRIFAASTGVVLAARTSGKIKAIVQGAGIIIFLSLRWAQTAFPSEIEPGMRYAAFYLVMVPVAVVTVLSGVDYVLSHMGAISAMMSDESGRS